MVAQKALERRADSCCATLDANDPWTDLPRGIVAHVLRMPALQLGNPMTFLVLVEGHDPPRRHLVTA
jgi:hypothetical protein